MNQSSDFIYDLIAMGRCCLDETYVVPCSTLENNKYPIQSFQRSGGGQAATSAVIVSILGGKSAYVGNLGQDDAGRFLLSEMNGFDVDTRLVSQPGDYKTPKALILVRQGSGERTILYEPTSSNHKISIPFDKLTCSKVLILDPEISQMDLEKVQKAKHPQSVIIYDAERKRKSLEPMMEVADFFIGSETILDIDENVDRETMFHQMRERIKGEWILTFGELGSVWIPKSGEAVWVKGMKVPVVDTTGAGDVYHAAYAFYWPKSGDVVECMKFATVASAKSVAYLGTRHQEMLSEELLKAEMNTVEVQTITIKDLFEILNR